jgi:UDP-N-acetylglucosamine pyrophosphorylase
MNSTEVSTNNLSTNSKTFKTRGQLLREKVNNLCDYLVKLSPDQKKQIDSFRNLSNEDLVVYICQNILPNRVRLDDYVNEWISWYKLPSDPEVKDRLVRYCQFFVRFMKA